MNSVTTKRFRKCYSDLPKSIQNQADKAYRLWKANSSHPSLDFGTVHPSKPVYSVRIAYSWRAVAILDDAVYVWFWIGSHEEYNKLLAQL